MEYDLIPGEPVVVHEGFSAGHTVSTEWARPRSSIPPMPWPI
ncbi:MAG: hypothetical protein ACTH6N_13640 [Brachybacterium tyrofermentans]|nr:hypothetical protein FM103_19475 [Corynebacterium xerosis]